MIRVIKFRAWRESQKFMLTPHSLVDLFDYGSMANPEGVVWMQFTGLTDKNGVEIYEGDVFFDGIENCTIEWCGNSSSFIANDGTEKHELGDWTKNELIIGNIHQNPELIK